MANDVEVGRQITEADLVVAALVAEGVQIVFGIPGTHNLGLYKALGRSGIRHIAPRHEQGGGYAADGYARASARPGVVITTSGPGATNAATALGTAYADSVPVLLISAGMRTHSLGRGLGQLHELKDQFTTLSSIAGSALRADSGCAAVEFIHRTFAAWRTGRPRPAYLELPYDVFSRPVGHDDQATGVPIVADAPVATGIQDDAPRQPQLTPDPGAVDAVVDRVSAAERAVLILGGGSKDAADVATQFAELADAVVITTASGKGVVSEVHPQSLGAVADVAPAHEVIRQADLVLVVGSELAESEFGPNTWQPQGYLVRVDTDGDQLRGRWSASVAIRADARAFFSAGVAAMRGRQAHPDGVNGAAARANALRVELQPAIHAQSGQWSDINKLLAGRLPRNTIVAGDSSQVSYRGTMYHWPMEHPRQFLYPAGFATLGYGLPSAIGAKLAEPDRPVLVLQGDGGLMFSIQELMTATALHLSIPVVVANNGGYAEITAQMRELGIGPLGTELDMPDFAALAEPFGAYGVRANDLQDAADQVVAALNRDRPTLIEVMVGG